MPSSVPAVRGPTMRFVTMFAPEYSRISCPARYAAFEEDERIDGKGLVRLADLLPKLAENAVDDAAPQNTLYHSS